MSIYECSTHTHTHTHTPVSYTHLDVYKRQHNSKLSNVFRFAAFVNSNIPAEL